MTIKISGQIIEELADTRATRSCLSGWSRSLLHKVVTRAENEQLLRTGNEYLVTPIGHYTSFRFDDLRYVLTLVVVSKCVSGVIMGCDVLSSHEALIDRTNSELDLNDYDDVDHHSPNFDIPLRAVDDIVVLPAYSLAVMLAVDTASAPKRKGGIVNPDSQLFLKEEPYLPASLLS